MKIQKSILAGAVCSVLLLQVDTGHNVFAASNSSRHSGSSKDSDDSSKSDRSGKSDSSTRGERKITICHAPPGNELNKHTIHIALSAWAAHVSNHPGDYVGSCNSQDSIKTKEAVHIISGCSDTVRQELITKIQSYYEPIIVEDTALDDENMVIAMSQCLDKGDSSDSNKGGADTRHSGGQGRGHDSVSDSGKHHYISGCQNKDTSHKADSNDHNKHGQSDSDKDPNNINYHKKLKAADSSYDSKKGIKDPLVVSDSNMDDSNIKNAIHHCGSDSNKFGELKGDSGHKYRKIKNCSNDSGLRNAIKQQKEKALSDSSTKIVVTESIYNDASILDLIKQCSSDQVDDSSNYGVKGESGPSNWREVTTPDAVIDTIKASKSRQNNKGGNNFIK